MTYPDSLRQQAEELRKAAHTVLDDPFAQLRGSLASLQAETDLEKIKAKLEGITAGLPTTSTTHLVTAITGFVMASMNETLADTCEYLIERGAIKNLSDRLKEHSRIQAVLRDAAASGNWEEFDALVGHRNGSGGTDRGNGGGGDGTVEAG